MPIDHSKSVAQINDHLTRMRTLRSKSRHHDLSDLGTDEVTASLVLSKTAIRRIAGSRAKPYLDGIVDFESQFGIKAEALLYAIGSLEALLSDVQNGFLDSIEEEIHADLFADFLEMAESHLESAKRESKLKDPAAMLIGAVLEEHLRKLCLKHGVPTLKPDGSWKLGSAMNGDLTAAGVYDKLQNKAVTFWQDIRNKADHAFWDQYGLAEVQQMLIGVRDFLLKFPA